MSSVTMSTLVVREKCVGASYHEACCKVCTLAHTSWGWDAYVKVRVFVCDPGPYQIERP